MHPSFCFDLFVEGEAGTLDNANGEGDVKHLVCIHPSILSGRSNRPLPDSVVSLSTLVPTLVVPKDGERTLF